MQPKMITKQIIDFNKDTFNNAFDAITVLQDQSEKMVGLFFEKAPLLPPEGKNLIMEWVGSYKKGRKDFKVAIDDSFKTVEDIFVSAANVMGSSVSGLVEKTEQSLREINVNDKIIRTTVAVVNESIKTVATVADKAVKKETISEGKPGTGVAKAVRKTVKSVKK